MRQTLLSAVYDQANIGLALLDLDGRILQVNQGFARLAAAAPAELAGQNFENIFHPADREPDFSSVLRRLTTRSASIEVQKRLQANPNDPTGVCIRLTRIEDENDPPACILAELTESRDRQAGKAKQDRLENLLEHTNDAIWSIDTAYRITALNSCFKREFFAAAGVDLDLGDRILDALAPPDRPEWQRRYDRALSGAQLSTIDPIPGPLGMRYFESTLIPIEVDGRMTGVSCYAHDITAQKTAEIELQNQRNFLEQVLNVMGQGLTVTNHEGRFEYVNPAYARLFGYQPQDLIGKQPTDVTLQEDRGDLSTQRRLRQEGLTSTYESRLIRADGSIANVLITGVPRLNNGQYGGAVASITDLTEYKRLQTDLAESEQRFRALYDTANRQAQDLMLLDRVRTILVNELDSGALIHAVVEGIAEIFGYRLVSLYLRQGDVMHLQHQVGYDQVFPRIPIEQGILGKTVRSGKAIFERNVHQDPDFLEANSEIGSEICVPLFDRGGVTGALNIEATTEAPLSDSDLRLMLALADNISVALERSRLIEQIRAREERFRLLFQQSPAGIFIFNHDLTLTDCNERFTQLFGVQRERIMGLDLNRIGQPKLIPLLQDALVGKKAEYNGPFESSSGRIILWISLRIAPLSGDQGQVQGGIGIVEDITERQKVEEAERERRILAEVLRDSANSLNSSLDLNQVLDNLARNVHRILPSDLISILLMAEDQPRIARVVGSVNTRRLIDTQNYQFAVHDTPNLSTMFHTGRPLIIPNTLNHPGWIVRPGQEWIRSYAGIPILFQGRVVGFIGLHCEKPGFYQAEHMDRLTAFANQVEIAFSNARLMEDLRKANLDLSHQIEQNRALQIELSEQVIRDPLTKLFNRRYLKETLDREISRARRESLQVGIIVMDIDLFKRINDRFGHQAGDRILELIGASFPNMVRHEDIVCRFGGEEFVIVMPGASRSATYERAEWIRASVQELCLEVNQFELRVTISLGVAVYPDHGRDAEETLINADRALYQAKRSGRNRVVIYDGRSTFNPDYPDVD